MRGCEGGLPRGARFAGKKVLEAEGYPGGAVPRRRGLGWDLQRKVEHSPSPTLPSLDLSEKLRKQAEKDKGKQGEGRTLPPSLSSRKWWEEGEDLLGG